MASKQNISKWINLAAVFLFAAAVFHFVSEKILLGIVFFGSAGVFASAAAIYQKKNAKDDRESKEDQRRK